MTKEHWAMVGCIAVFLLSLLYFALHVRQDGRFYRFSQRLFWSFLAVWMGALVGLFHFNPVTLAAAFLFGSPGILTVMAILHL